MWWRSVIWTGVIFGTFGFIVPNILWFLTWMVGKICSFRVPYAPFAYTGLALLLIVWGCLTYGHYFGRFKIKVNSIEYANSSVPAQFDGYKIVHISDLHVDSFEETKDLQKFIDKVNEQQADVILFTGDIMTSSMDGIYPYEETLKTLHAKDGVFSILGNHDFFIYEFHNDAERCAEADKLTTYERDILGWNVLRNASHIIQKGGDSIAIAGVDNINGGQGFPTIQKGDLHKALDGIGGVFTILMSHDPSHWKAEVLPKSDVQITLSGHTHAAQIRLFGWSFARLSFRECDGLYNEDGRILYVNAGAGCTAPFRIGCPSEVTVITLHLQNKKLVP